ncbi:MAG: type I restriction-modification system subunit M [Bacteroidales bacterium]|nr:type I restriction-modification system subunit M [Bacteroidales bacterium]
MATNKERDELHRTIWNIANSLRGAVDGWSFKAYVLGAIFYRYISENLCEYVKKLQEAGGVFDYDYSKTSDEEAEYGRETLVQEKGYFILPSQLFCRIAANPEADVNLNITLSNVFRAIEASAQGSASEDDLRGLFSDFIVDNSQLGNSLEDRNKLLAKVLIAVRDMDLGDSFDDTGNDTFGDAYEYLMQMYAANAGKSGGEFFTPQEVSELLARLASHDNPKISKVYDPACGSGSLLMKFARTEGKKNPNLKYFGQEINPTTYNLCRINMFLHNINCSNFDIQLGDTLMNPKHFGEKFDAIVSNPPYSIKWDGKKNPILMNDDRYSPAGVLAPDTKADLAFTMHMLYQLAETGTAAIVEFPGVLYRGGAEEKIRHYLLKNNFVDTIIQLPANLFFGVGIATCIIVLRKGKRPDNKVLFIDGSEQFVKVGAKNKLTEENQNAIFDAYAKRAEIQYFSKLVDVATIIENKCNLSVSSYVEQEDKREEIDIAKLNDEIDKLMDDIIDSSERLDFIIARELGGEKEDARKMIREGKIKEFMHDFGFLVEEEPATDDPEWIEIFKEAGYEFD